MPLPTFDPSFLLGFDEIGALLAQMTKGTEGFPPYNIEQLANGDIRIILAVAGYLEPDLEITHVDNKLIVRGSQQPDTRVYLHRGIAARTFMKSFVLADGMKILGADLENGLLCVNLERPKRAVQTKKITIKTKKTARVIETRKE